MQTKLSRYCECLLEATWIAAVIIIPIFFNIYSSRIFEPDKVAILRSLSLFSLAAWLIKIIEDGGIRWVVLKRSISLVKTLWNLPMLVPVVVLVIVYLISTLFSISPKVSLWGSYQRLQGTYTTISYLVLLAVVVGNLRKWNQVERLVTSIILASLPVTLYGLLQRFGIDPIPWAGNTTTRIAANMGNSIFVGAYLIMVIPLALGRLVKIFKNIVASDTNRSPYLVQASIYSFIVFLQFAAIYSSQSRGPVMGLLAGGFVMVLLLSFSIPKRWISYSVIGLGFVGGGLLLGFNLENSPMRNLRSVPGIGRFGMLLDSNSTTALTREYIWQGTADLVSLHEPLKYPNGETDTYNFLRPVIGYGPESLYVAFNQYYPPELGHVEKRNASPDRAHNETWDAMVITGLSGLIEYLIIFGSVFYFGVKWIGLIRFKRDVWFFILILIIGVATGALGFYFWRGIGYLGIGIPFGMLIGLIAYLIIRGLITNIIENYPKNNSRGRLYTIMLLASLVAHFIEINFGIAIVATRMLFWIYVGLLIVVGYILPMHDLNEVSQTKPPVREMGREDKRQGNRSLPGKYGKGDQADSLLRGNHTTWKRQMYIIGFIVGMIMVTLSYDYVINPSQETSIVRLLINSFTRLSKSNYTFSGGVLGLFAITLILAVLLFTAENELIQRGRWWGKSLVGALGVAIGIWIFFTVIFAGKLATIARATPQNQYDVLAQVGDVGGILSMYYIFIGCLLFGIAYFLVDRTASRWAASNSLGIIATPVLFSMIILLVNVTNLRIIYADIAFKNAEPFVSSNQWKMATLLYQRALELAPMEDHYYLFLGRSYLEQAKLAQTVQEQDELILQAESDLKIAQSINPLNTDHTANLARLYNWWASRAADTNTLMERGQIANDYYLSAVTLSPNNMTIWGDWAILNFKILRQPQTAFNLLTHAIEIDSQYSFTQGLMGDFFSATADLSEDTIQKKELLEQAISYYLEAIRVHTRRDTALKSTYLVSLGNCNIELAGLADQGASVLYNQAAVNALEDAIDSDLPEDDLWKVQETLAQLYAMLDDKHTALAYAESALSGASDNAVDRINLLIITIQAMP